MDVVTTPLRAASVLRLAVHQFAPRLRDLGENARRIAARARASSADVVLNPELSLTGYDVGDDATALARVATLGAPFAAVTDDDAAPLLETGGARVIIGIIERGERGIPYNSAVVLRDGTAELVFRKLYLPTYGMFDEGRFFGRGDRLEVLTSITGWRLGILICEDFWHPGLHYVLAAAGIDALLVMAAAPGRGVWEGGEQGGRFRSADVWERIARTTAQLYGVYVALANRTGVESAVTFAGGSLVVGPDGSVVARADEESDALLEVELRASELERARRPYAHGRDDDARLIMRELGRLLARP
jgi:predicted amidohydrolase